MAFSFTVGGGNNFLHLRNKILLCCLFLFFSSSDPQHLTEATINDQSQKHAIQRLTAYHDC